MRHRKYISYVIACNLHEVYYNNVLNSKSKFVIQKGFMKLCGKNAQLFKYIQIFYDSVFNSNS